MHRELTIASSVINDASDCYVIAEIGHNHQGDIEKCKHLFAQAKDCGAAAVKLQKRDNRSLYTPAMYDRPYDHENSFGATYGEHREFLEFDRLQYLELMQYARELGIAMFATPFDFASADFLAGLDMPAFKIASGDLKNTPLLKHVAKLGKPMIVSTGGAMLDDIRRAYDTIMPIHPHLALLQCTATYPTEPEDMHLRVISTLRQCFPDAVIGLSDHYNGIALSVAAYVLGARIVEKHFTLNRSMKGTDHAFSLEPIGMRKMIRDLQRTRVALGEPHKRTLDKEVAAITKMGKTLVAARDLPAGHILAAQDIAIKSPGGAMPPFELENLIGCKLLKPMQANEGFSFEALDQQTRKYGAAA